MLRKVVATPSLERFKLKLDKELNGDVITIMIVRHTVFFHL